MTENLLPMLTFARDVIQKMRAVTLPLFHDLKNLQMVVKTDTSPVTEADLQAEKLARHLITTHYPSHGIIGEEFEELNPSAEFTWTIDPIDGTENFMRGIVTWGSMVGLLHHGKPVLGVIDHPALDTCYYGAEGHGVYKNKARLTSFCPGPSNESLQLLDLIMTSTPEAFNRSGDLTVFHNLTRLHPRIRITGDCYAATQVLEGSAVGAVEYNYKVWDFAPVEALINQLGGEFCCVKRMTQITGPTLLSCIYGQYFAVEIMKKLCL